ncbi:MAG: ribonuclease P protein component [Chloroflexota bacterium]
MRGAQYLTKRQQFTAVNSQGRPWLSGLVVMKVLPNGLAISRYGFSVSKRVGNAVMRNRVKRLMREILRKMPLQPGWDIVVIARPAVAGTRYNDLRSTIEVLLSRAGLLISEPESGLTEIKTGSGRPLAAS